MHASKVAWLLPFFVTACFFHKTHQPQIQPFAPPVSALGKPEPAHPELPLSATIIPIEPLTADADAIVQEPFNPPVRRRRPVNRPAQEAPDNVPPTSGSTQQAATETPAVSAIGQLSSGDPSELRSETLDTLATTERGMKSLGRGLSAPEQKIAAQIRDLLKHARDALKAGDVDGAYTLASKAKVLLSELAH